QTPHAGVTPDDVHRAHASTPIRTPSSLAAVPAPVEAMIMRALDRSPTKRFLTVRQFVDEVSRIARVGDDKADPKQTQPMGKVGKPKGDLVQTLLGVRGSFGLPAAPAPLAPSSVPAAGATVAGLYPPPAVHPAPATPAVEPPPAAPMPAHLAAPPMSAPVASPTAPSGAATMMGVPSGAQAHVPPAGQAPSSAPGGPQPAPSADRSPWASPPTGAPEMPAPAAHHAVASAAAPPAIAPAASAAPAAPQVPVHAAPASVAAAPTRGPVAAAVDIAKPVVAAPIAPVVPQSPVVAPPKVANAAPKAAGGSGGKEEGKGKFRETMWFKKGELDSEAAVAAAEERARTGKDASADKADSLPMDERYKDDGSISRGDKEKYSLRTGATQMMSAMKGTDAQSSMSGKVSEDALIGEMKKGRGLVLILIALGIIALGAIIFLVMK
ncbi:MAG TPA: hypothetical protein VK427_01475, partial [Kofleriaceae bacterium]|nr:hypothetical protein [Kofleriaceae bacterium]